jgi:hypothetical protein
VAAFGHNMFCIVDLLIVKKPCSLSYLVLEWMILYLYFESI